MLINDSWSSQTRTIGNLSSLSNGAQLTNQMGTDKVTVNNGSINVTLEPKEVKILVK